MARIVERNGKYKVIIELGKDASGKRIRHTKEGFKTKKEAKAYSTIKENELLSGIIPTANRIVLKDFISDWYNNHVSKNNFASNTLTGYQARINTHIIPLMGNMQLNKIQVIDVQNFYHTLINNGLKNNSAKRVVLVLKKCLSYAKKLNLINSIPCDIEFAKEIKTNKIQFWTEQQLIYFLSEMKGTYLYFPCMLAAFTGMRIGEICGLRKINIDLNNLKIKVSEQTLNDKITKTLVHTDILKTSKSYRTISIPRFLADELYNYTTLNSNNEEEFLILSRRFEMCSPRTLSMDFTKKVSKYKEALEDRKKSKKDCSNYIQLPQITFHDLRHTHATILLSHGENIKVISERLGHESIKVTLDTYSHVLPTMEEHTALLLENVFKNKF